MLNVDVRGISLLAMTTYKGTNYFMNFWDMELALTHKLTIELDNLYPIVISSEL